MTVINTTSLADLFKTKLSPDAYKGVLSQTNPYIFNPGGAPPIWLTLLPIATMGNPGFKFEMLRGAASRAVAAEVVDHMSPAPIKNRIGLGKIEGEIPSIKIAYQMTGEKFVWLTSMDSRYLDAGVRQVFEDAQACRVGCLARHVYNIAQVFNTGKINLAGDGVNIEVDYGFQSYQQFAAPGTPFSTHASADPVGYINTCCDAIEAGSLAGVRPTRIITSRAVLNHILQCESVRTAIWGDNSTKRVITLEDLNQLLARMALPEIIVEETKIHLQTTANGVVTDTVTRLQPEKRMVFLPPASVTIGTSEWTESVEARMPTLVTETVARFDMGGLIERKITDDPRTLHHRGYMCAVPSLPGADTCGYTDADVIA